MKLNSHEPEMPLTPKHEDDYRARNSGIFIAKNRQQGFTLLEMLAAIAIFALISLSAWQMLQGTLSSKEVSSQKHTRLQTVEYAMLLMEQDLRQIIDRGVRIDGVVSEQSVFSSMYMLDSDDEAIAFIRLGWRNPQQQLPRSELQKVSYRLRDGVLERQHFHVLDPDNSEPVTRELLHGVNALKFRFYRGGEWAEGLDSDAGLPEGVAVFVDLDDLGVIERRFLMVSDWRGGETS